MEKWKYQKDSLDGVVFDPDSAWNRRPGVTEYGEPAPPRFMFLVPLNVGLLGFGDAGRVYLNGEPPGGWHTVAGVGFWLGALNPNSGITVMLANRRQERVTIGWGFSF